ncbi:MAG: hypothetical protein JO250_05360 [Armatimonadetes bacterium]|nr:hypothetical protein [Armatimonadota bacterium]
MAYVRTLRQPTRARQSRSVPGSLACAAARPLTLSASARRLSAPAPAARADETQEDSPFAETAASPAGGQA